MNAVRVQAQALQNTKTATRKGTITGYDPARYAVKVMLQPEAYETGWIPLGSPWVGNGWGMFTGPSVGDQIEVAFESGSHDAGAGALRFYSLVDVPLQVPSGECWLVHKSGAFIKLTNAPALTLGDGQGATITLANGLITSAGNWTHTGTFTATGEGTFNGGHTVSQHTHTQGADSHGDTEQPTNKPTG